MEQGFAFLNTIVKNFNISSQIKAMNGYIVINR